MDQFKGLKAEVSGRMHGISYRYTFYIRGSGLGLVLSVEPEFRRNGTETLDGILPRPYKRVQDAKAYITRQMGEDIKWE